MELKVNSYYTIIPQTFNYSQFIKLGRGGDGDPIDVYYFSTNMTPTNASDKYAYTPRYTDSNYKLVVKILQISPYAVEAKLISDEQPLFWRVHMSIGRAHKKWVRQIDHQGWPLDLFRFRGLSQVAIFPIDKYEFVEYNIGDDPDTDLGVVLEVF
jgi:hypothetical protein